MNHSPSVTRCEVDFSGLLEAMRKEEASVGLTTKEIAKQIGKSREKTREIIAEAMELGLVTVTEKPGKRIDGRPTTVPAYVMEVRQ
jgi:DNA-binding FadR family transcriptional regulator